MLPDEIALIFFDYLTSVAEGPGRTRRLCLIDALRSRRDSHREIEFFCVR